jgi:hypothetical protein
MRHAKETKETYLFEGDEAQDELLEAQREHDKKVDLLITSKGHQRLRAFGYEVKKVADSLPESTSDKRSF